MKKIILLIFLLPFWVIAQKVNVPYHADPGPIAPIVHTVYFDNETNNFVVPDDFTSFRFMDGELKIDATLNETWNFDTLTGYNVRYIHPEGSNSNNGSKESPWFGFQYASNQLSPGDVLFVRGGVYDYDDRQTITVSGTAGNEIIFVAYPDEEPVFDFWNKDRTETPQTDTWAIRGSFANHLKFIRLTVRRMWNIYTATPSPAGRGIGWSMTNSEYITFIQCVADSIAGRGFMTRDAKNVSYYYCDAIWCADPRYNGPGNAGTGFLITGWASVAVRYIPNPGPITNISHPDVTHNDIGYYGESSFWVPSSTTSGSSRIVSSFTFEDGGTEIQATISGSTWNFTEVGTGTTVVSNAPRMGGTMGDSIYFYQCRAWQMADQGWGATSLTYFIVDECWSFNNGIHRWYPQWQAGATYNLGDTVRGKGGGAGRPWRALQTATDIEPNATAGWESYWEYAPHPDDFWGGDGHGFKGGLLSSAIDSVQRIFRNSIATYNAKFGFHENSGNARPNLRNYNNLSAYNGGYGFYAGYTYQYNIEEGQNIYINNIAYNNGLPDMGIFSASVAIHGYNTFDTQNIIETFGSAQFTSPANINDSQFRAVPDSATNFAIMSAPRKLSGELPDLGDYWKLTPTSDFIDAGIDVGLPYTGTAPDLGPFEYVASGEPDPDPDPPIISDLLEDWIEYAFTPLFGLVQTTTIIDSYNQNWADIADNLFLLKMIVETQREVDLDWNDGELTMLDFSMRAMDVRNAINNNNMILFENMEYAYNGVLAEFSEITSIPEFDLVFEPTLLTTPSPQQFVGLFNWNLGILIWNTQAIFDELFYWFGEPEM